MPGRTSFANRRYFREPEYPAYYTSRGNARDGGSRAPEAQGDAKYLAAIPGRQSAGAGKSRRLPRFGDPADRNPHLMPVAFVQASGEWKDGRWTGKDVSKGKDQDPKATEGSQSRFDAINARQSGAGLGFASKPSQVQTTLKDWSSPSSELSAPEDESASDQLAALLQAFPGSEELQGTSDFDFEQPKMEFRSAPSSSKPLQPPYSTFTSDRRDDDSALSSAEPLSNVETTDAEVVMLPNQPTRDTDSLATSAAAPGLFQRTDREVLPKPTSSSSDEDDEMILIGQRDSADRSDLDSTRLTAQSDSEEERQLNAIIAAASEASAAKDSTRQMSASPHTENFTFDFTGETSSRNVTPPASAQPKDTRRYILGDEQEWEDAFQEHGLSRPSSSSRERTSQDDPRVEFSQIIADSSEDEFVPLPGKAGVGTRQPGQGRKARLAAKKARRKARKSGAFVGGGGEDDDDEVSASVSLSEPREPRTGDSDLEWGSDGPPDISLNSKQRRQKAYASSHNASGIDMQQLSLESRTGHRDLPKTRAEEERMFQEALAISAAQGNSQSGQSRGGVQFSSISVRGPSTSKRGMSKRQMEQEAILADYMENALRRQQSDSDDDEGSTKAMDLTSEVGDVPTDQTTAAELDAMIKFMQGMDGQQGGRQMTLGDIEDETKMNEEEAWMTESGDEDSDDDPENEGDDKIERAIDISERQEIGELDESISGSSESDSDAYDDVELDEDEDEDEDSEADSEEEDGRIFDRNFTWAAEDEAIIQSIERFARSGEGGSLRGSDKKAREKIQRAIEVGDFGELEGAAAGDLADLIDEEDMLGTQPAKKKLGKGKQRWGNDAEWASKLQSQWEKDRATKAANKRKRAEERRAAAQNPYPNTHMKKGTKKMAKKAARAARRAGNGVRTDDEAVDEWDPAASRQFSGLVGGKGQATNLRELDNQILAFLDDDGHTTMALPPMEKRSRAQVHMLADAYSIKSKSRGSGRSRFITLIKTKHSGVQVDTRKVARIISGRGEASFGVTMGKGGKKGKSVGGAGKGAGSSVAANKDGAEVGWGADKIGADNIGHQLLSMMGWSEGMGVGASGAGMANPVNATIKTSKGGLGF